MCLIWNLHVLLCGIQILSNDSNTPLKNLDLSLQDQNESAAILKIKETMQEEAKRFEKDVPPDHPDYFMPWRDPFPSPLYPVN